MNQQDSDQAMPLEDFLDETMVLLVAHPDAEQLLVENVTYFRYAEANGSFKEILGVLSNSCQIPRGRPTRQHVSVTTGRDQRRRALSVPVSGP